MKPYLVQRFTANSRTVHNHDLDTINKNLTDNKGLTHNSKSELSLFLKRKKKFLSSIEVSQESFLSPCISAYQIIISSQPRNHTG